MGACLGCMRAGAAAGALTALLGMALAATPAQARPICGPHSAQTLEQTGDVRVYVSRRDPYGGYVCFRGGRSYAIDEPETDEPTDHKSYVRDRGPIAIAGRFAAYVIDGDGSDGAEDFFWTNVETIDVKTGKRRVSSCPPVADPDETMECDDRLAVSSLVLKRNGSFAYIRTLTEGGRHVMRVDSRGQHELDRGHDVERGSLRLREGTRLRWLKAGVKRTASLR
jgi:hypothetical protein